MTIPGGAILQVPEVPVGQQPTPLDDLNICLQEMRLRRVQYALHADYYFGRHRLVFATDRWRNMFGPIFRKFFDNLCRTVVDVTVDKLQLEGFDTTDGDGCDDAWDLWQNLKMHRKANQVHEEMLRTGDAYVIVQQDETTKELEIYPQAAETCMVRYDDEHPDRVAFGFKWWALSDGRVRANLYYPDRTLKFITATSAQFDLPQRATAFVPWTMPEIPNELGVVPMFHFPNRANIGQLGVSELEDVVPLQDALNKAILDMMVNGEYISFPQRWAVGLELETDPDTGQAINPFTSGADRLWATGSSETQFGQFNQADMTQFINVQENYRLEIGRVSGTPLHYLFTSNQFPSGEAMKTAEARHVAKVERAQVICGEQWETIMALALKLSGQAMSDANATIRARWKNPEPRSQQLFSQEILAKKQTNVPDEQLWKEWGYSDEEIESFQQAKQDAMAQQMALFSQGQVPGSPVANPDQAKQAQQQGQQMMQGQGGTMGQQHDQMMAAAKAKLPPQSASNPKSAGQGGPFGGGKGGNRSSK